MLKTLLVGGGGVLLLAMLTIVVLLGVLFFPSWRVRRTYLRPRAQIDNIQLSARTARPAAFSVLNVSPGQQATTSVTETSMTIADTLPQCTAEINTDYLSVAAGDQSKV